jgi:hypothetical protein
VADFKDQRKKTGKEELHSFCQNTKIDRGESYFERYYRNGSSSWFHEIKMNRHAFASINHMGVGNSSLKASSIRLTLCPRLNANVVTSCKRRNISSGIVNCMRTKGQQ